MAALVTRVVHEVLEVEAGLAADLDLATAGLDSLRVIQLRNRLARALQRRGAPAPAWPEPPLTITALVAALERSPAIAGVEGVASVAGDGARVVRREQALALELRTSVSTRPGARGAPTYTLLHGYMQRGEGILRDLEGVVRADATLVAPDAPMCNAKAPGVASATGCFWYPLGGERPDVERAMVLAVGSVDALLSSLDAPVGGHRLIGFSQGGAVAAAAAALRTDVASVVMLMAPLRPLQWWIEWSGRAPSCELVAIMRRDDEFLDSAASLRDLEALRERGVDVALRWIDGRAHALDRLVLETLADVLASSRAGGAA